MRAASGVGALGKRPVSLGRGAHGARVRSRGL